MENIVKRERSTNFNKSEIRLLTELVAKHRTIIENKQTDAVTNKEKEAAWIKISSLFNAATGFTARSTKSLKLKYEGIKKETKKTLAKHRQELYKTGGGPSSAPEVTDIQERVIAICSNINGLDARNDSDKIPEPLELEETAKVDPLSLPLQSLENNLVIVPCDDDIPCTLDQEEFCPQQDLKEKVNSEIGNDKAFDDFQSIEIQDMEVDQTEKENKWSSWKPKALKTKISPYLKSNQKITKVGVTAKLDHLTESRLELVKLRRKLP
ncbi:uncharacterized protein LOC126055090 [Helicoverpa armigera]|uniref:uncharacterized protein LOC126056078 n=1 Tax=Helicoverpa armigera TaxID=29058 RepID=UPI003083905E